MQTVSHTVSQHNNSPLLCAVFADQLFSFVSPLCSQIKWELFCALPQEVTRFSYSCLECIQIYRGFLCLNANPTSLQMFWKESVCIWVKYLESFFWVLFKVHCSSGGRTEVTSEATCRVGRAKLLCFFKWVGPLLWSMLLLFGEI